MSTARKRFLAATVVATTALAGLAVSAEPAFAQPSDCYFYANTGQNGFAYGACAAGTGLYWTQASCGTSALNPVYVAIGPKRSPGGGNSIADCSAGIGGAHYLISASQHFSG
ncbi:hypothetical protein [Dactylosporangium sp. CA-233914]|uniref:hypothetical protein n=1 Tax=Dactylosporangium sp. CA-233914 TaxID=3239934 RepID=UPI003D8E5E3E